MYQKGLKFLLASPTVLFAILLFPDPILAANLGVTSSGIGSSETSQSESARVAFFTSDTTSDITPLEAQAALPASNLIARRPTSISELSDVQPSDWAFQALQNLVERYGVIEGYPDGTFRGNRAMTRYEFAAGLNAVLMKIQELTGEGFDTQVPRGDLETLEKLQGEFGKELATLRGRVDALEARTGRLEAFQFSTTTRLSGQVVVALNGGFQEGTINRANTIFFSRDGRLQTIGNNPNVILFSRVRLTLNTSFTGRDRLVTQLQASTSSTGNRASSTPGVGTDAADYLADRASGLHYSPLPGGIGFQLNRLSYTFPLTDDLTISIFPRGYATDYIDIVTYANKANDNVSNFSTESLVNNILLFAQDLPSAGAAAIWKPGNGSFTIRAVYAAQDATVPNPTGLTGLDVPLGSVTDVYGNVRGDKRGGLFGDPYIGFLEFEYAQAQRFAVRFQYAGGAQGGSRFDALGFNFEYAFSPSLAIFGRYGYSPNFLPIPIPGIQPHFWQLGVALPTLSPNSSAGVSIAQPLIFRAGRADQDRTQTNYEAYYRFLVNDNIAITPLIQVVTNPLNSSTNGTIFTGTVRTVFSF